MDTVWLALLRAVVVLAVVVVLYPPLAWLERWVALGPTDRERLGEAPLLPVQNALKLLSKRAPPPPGGDGLVHSLAPVLLLVPGLFVLAQIPPCPPWAESGTSFSLAVTAGHGSLTWALGLLFVTPVGILLAGWSGGDNLALLGGLRLATVRASALVVVGMGTLGTARVLGTTQLDQLIAAQAQSLVGGLPALGLFAAPLGFGTTVVALAVLHQRGQRTRPEQNADLVESYAITARGPTLLAHRLFEVVDLLATSSLLTAIFLGGWLIPGLDDGQGAGWEFVLGRFGVWLLKVLLVASGILLLRRTLPPLRHDQALRLVWIVLLPICALGLVGSEIVADFLSLTS